jgi:squalene-hopene/tetraprenyl-beta-curcumene cyclase
LWLGVLAFGVLGAGDPARTPSEVLTLRDFKTEGEPQEGPLADPAAPAIADCQQTPAGKPAATATKSAAGTSEESLAPRLSLARSAEFLDQATLGWIREQKCASCHTGYPYLLARASLGDLKAPALREVRSFFEGRVAAWDQGGKGVGYLKGSGPVKDSEGVTEVVAIATALALHDAQAGERLRPQTRQALDRMWELQREDGSWPWNKTRLAPLEYDDYYGVVVAALGAGHAPEGYAKTEAGREGVSRLRRYLRKNPPPNLHHKTWLLWASLKLDGLMEPAERDRTVSELLALQRPDGGWNLPSLGDWKRRDGTPNDKNGPSDGYATGLVLYVLRQAGVPATADPVQRGVTWLKTHQRASGRWFTRSLNGDKLRSISHAGTAYAVMALKACDVSDQ